MTKEKKGLPAEMKTQGPDPVSSTRRSFLRNGLAIGTAASARQLIPGSTAALLKAGSGAKPNPASQALTAFLAEFTAHPQREEAADLSAAAFAARSASTRNSLAGVRSIDFQQLGPNEQINYRFAESILVGREISEDKIVPWKKDPRVYMQFRGLSRALGRSASKDKKAQETLRILKGIPGQLEDGKRNLSICVPRFRELGIFMADNAMSLFRNDVAAFAEELSAEKVQLLAANSSAIQALSAYRAFLENDLAKLPRGDFAIGKATYDSMLKGQYLLGYDSDSLYEFGWQQFHLTVQQLERVARAIDSKKTWQELASQIKEEGPDPLKMIEVHQLWVNKARAHILEKSLVPIPWKERVDVVPREEYLRKTSYYGNFSPARGPDAEGVLVGQWQINTFDSSWDETTKRQYMLEHDWGVIIDTAPHETYAGHHVQFLYQLHNADKLRRDFDISIFAEGWGLYNETLMQETGFFPNERIHLRQLQLRLWRVARVIWDVGIHTGKMTYEEGVSLLADKVGFQRWAAQLEVDGSAEQPGYRIGYFMGYSEIIKMREEFRQRRGVDFTLSDFHERLLKVGSMPPALMREGLMNSIAAR